MRVFTWKIHEVARGRVIGSRVTAKKAVPTTLSFQKNYGGVLTAPHLAYHCHRLQCQPPLLPAARGILVNCHPDPPLHSHHRQPYPCTFCSLFAFHHHGPPRDIFADQLDKARYGHETIPEFPALTRLMPRGGKSVPVSLTTPSPPGTPLATWDKGNYCFLDERMNKTTHVSHLQDVFSDPPLSALHAGFGALPWGPSSCIHLLISISFVYSFILSFSKN